jgi:hypothetical protein
MDPANRPPAVTGDAASLSDESDSADAAVQSNTSDTSVNDLADTLIKESPEPQPHAIAQRAEQEAAALSQSAANVQQFPGFNPEIHATNPDGTPALTPTGRLAKIRKSRAAGTKTAVNVPNVPGATTPAQSAAVAKETLARQGGAGCANLVIALMVGVGGEDFLPRRDKASGMDEKAMLESVFGDYFVATGKTDLPPGWALVAGMSMYVLPRLGMPKTQTRLQRFKDWCKVKYVNFRLKKAGIKARARNTSEANAASEALAGRGTVPNGDNG